MIWQKHVCGGQVCAIPKEYGGGSAHIIPKSFGSKKTRLRLHDNPLSPYFFHHQFYPCVRDAKKALIDKLEINNKNKG